MIILILCICVAVAFFIFESDTTAEKVASIFAGAFGFLLIILFCNNYWGKTMTSLEKEKTSLISEYSSYVDKSEVLDRMKEHNSRCNSREDEANSIWLNPTSLFKDYDFNKYKIDIDNLKD